MRETATTLCPPQCRFLQRFPNRLALRASQCIKRCKIDTVGDIKFVAKSLTRASCRCQRRRRKQEQAVNSPWGGHVSTNLVPELTNSCASRLTRRAHRKNAVFLEVCTACTRGVHGVHTPRHWFSWCFMNITPYGVHAVHTPWMLKPHCL